MAFEVPETGRKRQFSYNAVEGKHFLITSEEDCVRIELQLLVLFLKDDVQPWLSDNLWTQVGILAGKSAATSNFNLRQEYVRVSLFFTEIYYDVRMTCLLLCFASSGMTYSVHLS